MSHTNTSSLSDQVPSTTPLTIEQFKEKLAQLTPELRTEFFKSVKSMLNHDAWVRILQDYNNPASSVDVKNSCIRILYELTSIQGQIFEYTNTLLQRFSHLDPSTSHYHIPNAKTVFADIQKKYEEFNAQSKNTLRNKVKEVIQSAKILSDEVTSSNSNLSSTNLVELTDHLHDLKTYIGAPSAHYVFSAIPVEIGCATRSFVKHVGNIHKPHRPPTVSASMEQELELYARLIETPTLDENTLKSLCEPVNNSFLIHAQKYCQSLPQNDPQQAPLSEILSEIQILYQDYLVKSMNKKDRVSKIEEVEKKIAEFIRIPLHNSLSYQDLKSTWEKEYSAAARINKMHNTIRKSEGSQEFLKTFRYKLPPPTTPHMFLTQYLPLSRNIEEVAHKFKIATLLQQIAQIQGTNFYPDLENVIKTAFKLIMWLQFEPYTQNTMPYVSTDPNITHTLAWRKILKQWDSLLEILPTAFFPSAIISKAFASNKSAYANRILRSWGSKYGRLISGILKTLRAQINNTPFGLDSTMKYFPFCDTAGKIGNIYRDNENADSFISSHDVYRALHALDPVEHRLNQKLKPNRIINRVEWEAIQNSLQSLFLSKPESINSFSTQIPIQNPVSTPPSSSQILDRLVSEGAYTFFVTNLSPESNTNIKSDFKDSTLSTHSDFYANDIQTLLCPFSEIDHNARGKGAIEDRISKFTPISSSDPSGLLSTYITELKDKIDGSINDLKSFTNTPTGYGILRWQSHYARFCQSWLEKVKSVIDSIPLPKYASYYHLSALEDFCKSLDIVTVKICQVDSEYKKNKRQENHQKLQQLRTELKGELDQIQKLSISLNPAGKPCLREKYADSFPKKTLPGFASDRYQSEFITTAVNTMVAQTQAQWSRITTLSTAILNKTITIPFAEMELAFGSEPLEKIYDSQKARFGSVMNGLGKFEKELLGTIKPFWDSFLPIFGNSTQYSKKENTSKKFVELLTTLNTIIDTILTEHHITETQFPLKFFIPRLLSLDSQWIGAGFSAKIKQLDPTEKYGADQKLAKVVMDLANLKAQFLQKRLDSWIQQYIDAKLIEINPTYKESKEQYLAGKLARSQVPKKAEQYFEVAASLPTQFLLRYRNQTSAIPIQWITELQSRLQALRSARIDLSQDSYKLLRDFLWVEGDPPNLKEWSQKPIWVPRLLRVLNACRQRYIPSDRLTKLLELFVLRDSSTGDLRAGALLHVVFEEGRNILNTTVPEYATNLLITDSDSQWLQDDAVVKELQTLGAVLYEQKTSKFEFGNYVGRNLSQIWKESYLIEKYCDANRVDANGDHINAKGEKIADPSPYMNVRIIQRWVRHTLSPYYTLKPTLSPQIKQPYHHLKDTALKSHLAFSGHSLKTVLSHLHSPVEISRFFSDSFLPQFVGQIFKCEIKTSKSIQYNLMADVPTTEDINQLFLSRHESNLNDNNKKWETAWNVFLELIKEKQWDPVLLSDKDFMELEKKSLTRNAGEARKRQKEQAILEEMSGEFSSTKKITAQELIDLNEKWNGKQTRFETILNWYNLAQNFQPGQVPENLIGFKESLLQIPFNRISDTQFLVRDSHNRIFILTIIQATESIRAINEKMDGDWNKKFWAEIGKVIELYKNRLGFVLTLKTIPLKDLKLAELIEKKVILSETDFSEYCHRNPLATLENCWNSDDPKIKNMTLNPIIWRTWQKGLIEDGKNLPNDWFSNIDWNLVDKDLKSPKKISAEFLKPEIQAQFDQEMRAHIDQIILPPKKSKKPNNSIAYGYVFTYQFRPHPNHPDNMLNSLQENLTELISTSRDSKSEKILTRKSKLGIEPFGVIRDNQFVPSGIKKMADFEKILKTLATYSENLPFQTLIQECLAAIKTNPLSKSPTINAMNKNSGNLDLLKTTLRFVCQKLSPFLIQMPAELNKAILDITKSPLGEPCLQCLPNGEIRLIQSWSQPQYNISPLYPKTVFVGNDQGLREHAVFHAESNPQSAEILKPYLPSLITDQQRATLLQLSNQSASTFNQSLGDLNSKLSQTLSALQKDRDHAFRRNRLRECGQAVIARKHGKPKLAMRFSCYSARANYSQDAMYKNIAHRTARLMCDLPNQLFPDQLSHDPIYSQVRPILLHSVALRLEALDVPRYKGGRSVQRKQLNQRSAQWIYGLTTKYCLETVLTRGIQYLPIDPAYTSQVCPICGIIGTKGYVVRLSQDSNSQDQIHALLIPSAKWLSGSNISSLPLDTIHALTLTNKIKKKIIVTLKSNNFTFGFYPQTGGTAFRCNNPYCTHCGQVTGRDDIGAWNIATKNTARWSLLRIKNHIVHLTQHSVPVSLDHIPLLETVSTWSETQRREKICRELTFLRKRYEICYSLFDLRNYDQWFRSKDQGWKWNLGILTEFQRWKQEDWKDWGEICEKINNHTNLKEVKENLEPIRSFSPNSVLQIPRLLSQTEGEKPTFIHGWKHISELIDPEMLPKNRT